MLTPFSSSPPLPLHHTPFRRVRLDRHADIITYHPLPLLDDGCWLVGWLADFSKLGGKWLAVPFRSEKCSGGHRGEQGGFEGTPEKLLEIAFVRNNGVGKCFYILRAQVFGSKRAKGEQASSCLVAEGADRETPSCASQHETGNRIAFMILFQHEIEYSLQVNVWFFRWWWVGCKGWCCCHPKTLIILSLILSI